MPPVVHVLLATCNGRAWLAQQWASLEAQEGVGVVVHVADDDSSDGTPQLLRELAAAAGGAIVAVHWMDAAPRHSATRSFLQLLAHAVRQQPQARWFAYCDQDDLWLPGKLAAAHAALAGFEDSDRPALYGGRTLDIDASGRPSGLSAAPRQALSFGNALAQNVIGGNTMLMNRAAAELVAAASGLDVVAHDWYTYLLVSGAGGHVHFDGQAYVQYRQHRANLVGSTTGWRPRWRRLVRRLRGDYREWNALNLAALRRQEQALTPANRAVLEAFAGARAAGAPWTRLASLRRSGVFRQGRREQAMLWLACALRRL